MFFLFIKIKSIKRPVAPATYCAGSFLFLYFFKKILQEYIFDFTFYSSIPLPPGRGAARGGRDFYVNKIININIICAEVLGGGLPPRCRAAGPLPPSGGAAGGRQAPAKDIKAPSLPSRPHFLPTRSREGRGRDEG